MMAYAKLEGNKYDRQFFAKNSLQLLDVTIVVCPAQI